MDWADKMANWLVDTSPNAIQIARELRTAKADAFREAAQICDKPFHVQHPTKPAGVSMISVTPDEIRGNYFRNLASKLDPPTNP